MAPGEVRAVARDSEEAVLAFILCTCLAIYHAGLLKTPDPQPLLGAPGVDSAPSM